MISVRVLETLSTWLQGHEYNSFSLFFAVTEIHKVPCRDYTLVLNILNDVGISCSNHVSISISWAMVIIISVGEDSESSVSKTSVILVIWFIIGG